ncbi:MAG: prolipoprotein diacylglyceryl transferase [Cytophagales bacterium]|nr:prolipoprotein diacylglyceryl transferase [Bernardetiaceae bacterium]MDW8211498.1 prolipoprotein diacylglyceryl transferase [Cytophagales bacterium]
MEKSNWIERLQKRWGVKGKGQVVVILLVFACTGVSILYIKKLLLPLLGVSENTPRWLRFVISLVIILPLYQIVLLALGFLFGQFKFFWEFEKKIIYRSFAFFQKRQSKRLD